MSFFNKFYPKFDNKNMNENLESENFNRHRSDSSSYTQTSSSSSSSPSSKNSSAEKMEKISNNNNCDIASSIPQDSVTVLNELKPGLFYYTKASSNHKILATVEIEGKTFFGSGTSETLAKQSAAEGALRHLMFNLIMSTMTNDDNDFSVYNDKSWKLLRSFSMFKLIEEWLIYYSSEEYYKTPFEITSESKEMIPVVDEKNNTDVKTKKNIRDSMKKEKKIISKNENAIKILNSLIGNNINFHDMRITGDKPPFGLCIFLDGVKYKGESAGSKKEAKQNAARKVLEQKFRYEVSKEYVF